MKEQSKPVLKDTRYGGLRGGGNTLVTATITHDSLAKQCRSNTGMKSAHRSKNSRSDPKTDITLLPRL